MEMLGSGDIKVKLSNDGFDSPLNEDRNVITINWISGTMELLDICDYKFQVEKDGSTKVSPPEVASPYPEISFGGRLLKAGLKATPTVPMLGNTPRLYAISPTGEDSFQILRDSDQLRYFQSNQNDFYRTLEEASSVPGSVTFTTTKEFSADGLDQTLIQYAQVTPE